jgi:hypothetical protein
MEINYTIINNEKIRIIDGKTFDHEIDEWVDIEDLLERHNELQLDIKKGK